MPFAAKQMFRGGGENALIFPNGFVDAINGIGDGDGAASFCITASVSITSLMTALQTGQSASVALESGVSTQAISAFQSHTPVMLVLSIAAQDGETVMDTVQCMLSELAATDLGQTLIGTCGLHIDMMTFGAPVSCPVTIAYDIGLLSDNLLLVPHPERIPLVVKISRGDSIADDVEIDGKTVASIKESSGLNNVDIAYPIYNSATIEQTQTLLQYIYQFGQLGAQIIISVPLTSTFDIHLYVKNPVEDATARFGSATLYASAIEIRLVLTNSDFVFVSGMSQ